MKFKIIGFYGSLLINIAMFNKRFKYQQLEIKLHLQSFIKKKEIFYTF